MSKAPQTSYEAREQLIDYLQVDLIGADPTIPKHLPLLEEVLDQPPTSWYLTGFLAPSLGQVFQLNAEESESNESDLGAQEVVKGKNPEEDDDSLKSPAHSAFPSTLGFTAYIPDTAKTLYLGVTWGDYERVLQLKSQDDSSTEIETDVTKETNAKVVSSSSASNAGGGQNSLSSTLDSNKTSAKKLKESEEWRRQHRQELLLIDLSDPELLQSKDFALASSRGFAPDGQLCVHVAVRDIAQFEGLRSVSCFLVNQRHTHEEYRDRDMSFAFQAQLYASLSQQDCSLAHQQVVELSATESDLSDFNQHSQVLRSLFHLNAQSEADQDLSSTDKHSNKAASAELVQQFQLLPFEPSPIKKYSTKADPDQTRDALLYRHIPHYGTGHHCSIQAKRSQESCYQLSTTWRPTADVLFVKHQKIDELNLKMTDLARVKTHAELVKMLTPLCSAYEAWIKQNKLKQSQLTGHKDAAKSSIQACKHALTKIKLGLRLLEDDLAFEAFKIMNQSIGQAIVQNMLVSWLDSGQSKESFSKHFKQNEPQWRLFQLAFILMNLPGLLEEDYSQAKQKVGDQLEEDQEELIRELEYENNTVDLLFFPTGGGKTEAYLGLSAFTLALRRLRNPSASSSGVTVLMRYTLRLLTLDQLGRISALICALELERQRRLKHPDKFKSLGEWPFEVGLWVGQATTPNHLKKRKPKDRWAAETAIKDYKNDDKDSNFPLPLRSCPWCQSKLNADSFIFTPNDKKISDLLISCSDKKNLGCPFRVKDQDTQRGIPVLLIDQMIYRRLPSFLIATVDKFAQLPWRGEVGSLFGQVSHFDAKTGFYGPMDESSKGQELANKRLPPPRLIIQDELHLISGPLGTLVGVYEVALNALCNISGYPKPKIVASTATARRSDEQVRLLYGRQCRVFPPPGFSARDNFFAQQCDPTPETPARLYVGLSAPGRAHKQVQLLSSLTLLAAAKTLWDHAKDAKIKPNPLDPYMTIVGYYNTLRELGGSRRMAEDELSSRLTKYSERKRVWPKDIYRFNDRASLSEVVELTSRVSSSEVAKNKERLAASYATKKTSAHVDIALATNMISVGLDISRLGLMTVIGQPKSTAEYIQATSRVGRQASKPGLVLNFLHSYRPRDRSHYEVFQTWHESFYRGVEANSLTPFSSRALERGFIGSAVGLIRHLSGTMTKPSSAQQVKIYYNEVKEWLVRYEDWVADVLRDEPKPEQEQVLTRIKGFSSKLLTRWTEILDGAEGYLQYGKEEKQGSRALLKVAEECKDDENLAAPMSLRDVEPSIPLYRIDHLKREKWPHSYAPSNNNKKGKIPPDGQLRRSQLITTFGPGAMMDLPDLSAVMAHLGTWNRAFEPLKEPRLKSQIAGILNKSDFELFAPRIESKTALSGVGVHEFPTWFLVDFGIIHPQDGLNFRRRLLVKSNDGRFKNNKFTTKINGASKTTDNFVPIRFVQACPLGHLDDINWKSFVHFGKDLNQSCQLYFDEAGSGHNFLKIFVRCTCNKERRLADARAKGSLGKCTGAKPWVNLKNYKKTCIKEDCNGEDSSCQHIYCNEDAHLLTRTASNAYFSSLVSALSLPTLYVPDPTEKLREALAELETKNEEEATEQDVIDAVNPKSKPHKAFRAIIESIDAYLLQNPTELWQKFSAIKQGKSVDNANGETGGESKKTTAPKGGKLTRPEIDFFLSIPEPNYEGEIFKVPGFEQFEAERYTIPNTVSWFNEAVDQVIMFHRLREVSALIGFTRLEPLADDEQTLSDQQLEITRATIMNKYGESWLPAMENLGEGLFFTLNIEKVKLWASQKAVQERMKSFAEGRIAFIEDSISQREIPERDASFVLMHTISHALISQISLSCGYTASSLKERLYVFDDVCGVLIYTGTPSSDGTLGGLVDEGKKLDQHLAQAILSLEFCASDPICAEHEPKDPMVKRFLHGAACHSCSMVSETSCTHRNHWLDRSFVLPTMSSSECAFFKAKDLKKMINA